MGLSTAMLIPGAAPKMKSETLLLLLWKTLSLNSPVSVNVGVMVTGLRRAAPSVVEGGSEGLPGGSVNCADAGAATRHSSTAASQPAPRPDRVTIVFLARTLSLAQRFFWCEAARWPDGNA